VEAHGPEPVHALTHARISAAANNWRSFSAHTRCTYSKCLRRFLRWLHRCGAITPTLDEAVPHFHQPPHRTVKATDEERHTLLAAASLHMRFFLLLCSDHGLRHQFAARITPRHYNPHTRALTFVTKGGHTQTLPVSVSVQQIFASLPATADLDTPVVNLLRPDPRGGRVPGPRPRFTKQWKALKTRCGIREELRIHDLRRTVAEDVWQATKDLRLVQAQLGHKSISTTAKYLAHTLNADELRPIIGEVAAMRAARMQKPRKSHHVPQPESIAMCDFCPNKPHCTPADPICRRDRKDTDA
jgi:integrase